MTSRRRGNGIDAPALLRRLVLEQVVPASKGPCLAGTFGMVTDRSSGSHATRRRVRTRLVSSMRYAGRRRWPLIVPRTDAGGLLQILAGVGDGTGECATLLCMATLPATAANNPRGRGSVQALIPGRGVRALVTAVPIVVPVGMRA